MFLSKIECFLCSSGYFLILVAFICSFLEPEYRYDFLVSLNKGSITGEKRAVIEY